MSLDAARKRQQHLKVLLERGTSKNAKSEIRKEFAAISEAGALEDKCCYYQGCGSDLITLACDSVHSHVLSDTNACCADAISEKLNSMLDAGFISELDSGQREWRFVMNGTRKHIVFTESPIHDIQFESLVDRPLGLVFELNCGDSARKKVFWDTVAKEMVAGGHVIGSYASDLESADRIAFVLDKSPLPCLWGYAETLLPPELEAEIIRVATDDGWKPTKVLERYMYEFDRQFYVLCLTGRRHTSVTRAWRESVATFGLTVAFRGERMCRFSKL